MISIRFDAEEGAMLPEYGTDGAAGADIRAFISSPITLHPGERIAVPYEVQIRPRSGLALKSGITVLNAPGTIDSDYRGEVKVILINLSSEDFIIHSGDRIAQMVVHEVKRLPFERVSGLSSTDRGEGGFGSTGV